MQQALRAALDWLEGLGALAPVFFIVTYVLTTVLFVPGFILTLGAGILFGVVLGTATVSIAATLGATAAFIIGRYLAREWVEQKIQGRPKFAAVDKAVAREGWKIVLLTRLSPIFPFNLLNYAFGLTRVSLGGYFLASWIGMLPGTLMYVYIGSLIGNLALLGTDERSRTTLEWIFYGAGLLVAVAVTFYVTRLARNALQERVAPEPTTADAFAREH
jgi:uncharacterized membrane protein YdjX (TVP38/TMEM64 family)